MVCLIVSAFHSIAFLHDLPGFIARLFKGVGMGFEEPHIRLLVSLGKPGFCQIVLYFCICGSSGWAVITPNIGNWFFFRIVRMAFCIQDNDDMRQAKAPHRWMTSRLRRD